MNKDARESKQYARLDLLPDELGVRPLPFDLWIETPINQRVYGPGVQFQNSKRND